MKKNTTQTFTHLNENGEAQMVDVSAKKETPRLAIATITVVFDESTFAKVREGKTAKGDMLAVAKIAAISAAKKTAELIPLCHPIFLSLCDARFFNDEKKNRIIIYTMAKTTAVTGVEMEAVIAAQTAAAAIYDMCKAVSKKIKITRCELLYKSGGKSGIFKNGRAFAAAYKHIKIWLN